jgi:hypothetical protein
MSQLHASGRVFAIARVLALAVLAPLTLSCASEGKQREAELARIEALFPGHYSNAAQVQEEIANRAPGVREVIDIVVVRVSSMMIGEMVFYEQQFDAANPREVLRQRMHRFEKSADGESIMHTILSFRQPERWKAGHLRMDVFKSLLPDDLAASVCPLTWKVQGASLVGENTDEGCRGPKVANGETESHGALTRSQLRIELSAQGLVISERALAAGTTVPPSPNADPFYRFDRRGG